MSFGKFYILLATLGIPLGNLSAMESITTKSENTNSITDETTQYAQNSSDGFVSAVNEILKKGEENLEDGELNEKIIAEQKLCQGKCNNCTQFSNWVLHYNNKSFCATCLPIKIENTYPQNISSICSEKNCQWKYKCIKKNTKYPPIICADWLNKARVKAHCPYSAEILKVVSEFAHKLVYTNGLDLWLNGIVKKTGDNNSTQIKFISEYVRDIYNNICFQINEFFPNEFFKLKLSEDVKSKKTEIKKKLLERILNFEKVLVPICEYFLIRREFASGWLTLIDGGFIRRHNVSLCNNLAVSKQEAEEVITKNELQLKVVEMCFRGLINLMWDAFFGEVAEDFASFVGEKFYTDDTASQLSGNVIEILLNATFYAIIHKGSIPDFTYALKLSKYLNGIPFLGDTEDASNRRDNRTIFSVWYGYKRKDVIDAIESVQKILRPKDKYINNLIQTTNVSYPDLQNMSKFIGNIQLSPDGTFRVKTDLSLFFNYMSENNLFDNKCKLSHVKEPKSKDASATDKTDNNTTSSTKKKRRKHKKKNKNKINTNQIKTDKIEDQKEK